MILELLELGATPKWTSIVHRKFIFFLSNRISVGFLQRVPYLNDCCHLIEVGHAFLFCKWYQQTSHWEGQRDHETDPECTMAMLGSPSLLCPQLSRVQRQKLGTLRVGTLTACNPRSMCAEAFRFRGPSTGVLPTRCWACKSSGCCGRSQKRK